MSVAADYLRAWSSVLNNKYFHNYVDQTKNNTIRRSAFRRHIRPRRKEPSSRRRRRVRRRISESPDVSDAKRECVAVDLNVIPVGNSSFCCTDMGLLIMEGIRSRRST
eukprot:689826-Pleurochrysis_carterae.AAC.1